MAFTPSLTNSLLLIAVIVVLLPSASAFGAGDIPDFAYLNDKAFRHGDIENVLENLVKSAGGAAMGGGAFGFAQSLIEKATGGSKFSKSDVKKVYFGNWLRDYSQAMDIAGLSKLTADTLVLVVSVLGFMTFGFATEEFQVTADRLGVYLPVEHIDNPKGYAEKEGDARQFHPKLRPPVNLHELEFDERTGMKKYMATEDQSWDTSTAFIRRTFRRCIEAGRRARGQENADLWEAYRLLGTGLHTMEDLLAHSNWCEVALRKIGHREVFCHVGDNVVINTPNGRAPPLVTGTFGSADFLHSLLGEAGDKLSQASVTDLFGKMNQASQGGDANSAINSLKNIFSKLPIGGGNQSMNQAEEIHAQAKAYNFDPNNIAPLEVQQRLLELLKWHDSIMRDILAKIEMVPGLSNLIDELSNALNAYVYTVLAPYIGPVLTQATGVLDEGSKTVIDNDDQYEVFTNPNASDPSHSQLSKDHFGLILNEPAGKIAQIVVEHSVNLIVPAWSTNSNPDHVINQILEAFHHPYYATGRSDIQNKMFQHMEMWIGGLGSEESAQVIQALTKESVRNHKNKRLGSENHDYQEAGYGSCGHGAPAPKQQQYSQSYSQNQPPSDNPFAGRGTKSGPKWEQMGRGDNYNEPQYGTEVSAHVNQAGRQSYPQNQPPSDNPFAGRGTKSGPKWEQMGRGNDYNEPQYGAEGSARVNPTGQQSYPQNQPPSDNHFAGRGNKFGPKWEQMGKGNNYNEPQYGTEAPARVNQTGQQSYPSAQPPSDNPFAGRGGKFGPKWEQMGKGNYGTEVPAHVNQTARLEDAYGRYDSSNQTEAYGRSSKNEGSAYDAYPQQSSRRESEQQSYGRQQPLVIPTPTAPPPFYGVPAEPSYGGGRGAYSSTQAYGGGPAREERGGRNEGRSENIGYTPAYGQQTARHEQSYGAGESGGYGGSGREQYGQNDGNNAASNYQGYNAVGTAQPVRREEGYGTGEHGGHRGSGKRDEYGSSYGGGENYGGNAGPNYRGSEDSFGAENLRIKRNSDDEGSSDDEKRHGHRKKHHHGGGQGY